MRKILIASAGALMLATQPAAAADMPVKAPIYKAPVVDVWSWDGYYVGGNVGYSWGHWNSSCAAGTACFVATPGTFTTTAGFLGAFTNSASPNVDGVLGGIQYGRNWQHGNWVLGLESDLDWTGERARRDGTVSLALEAGTTTLRVQNDWKFRWVSTSRGRLGWASDKWLVYGTAGLAWGRASYSETATATAGGVSVTNALSESRTRFGFAGGGGIEWMIARHWTVGAEYLYVDLGDTRFLRGTAAETTIKLRDNIVRAKLNYLFDWSKPVVARY